MLKDLLLVIFISFAYIFGFLLNQLAKSEFKWFQKRSKQQFGRLRYIIAVLGGFSIGPNPPLFISISVFGILTIYSSLISTNQTKKNALALALKQATVFILAGIIGILF